MTTATTTPEALAGASDEELAPRLAARDEAAVALLLERWWARAYRLSLQLVGDASIAEDVAQEAFVQALRAARGFDPARGAFAPWFLRIVRNAAFNAARARARRSGHEAAAARPEAAPDDPAAQAAATLDAAGVRAHLAALTPQYREAVALHCLQGLTFQEVADVVGCPLGTVASRVRRGLDHLRARLAAGATAATSVVVPPADADLTATLLSAFADVPAPAGPSGAALLARAAAPTSADGATSTRRPRLPSRATALLALAGLLGALTATVVLLLPEPVGAPRQVVVVTTPTPDVPEDTAVELTRSTRAVEAAPPGASDPVTASRADAEGAAEEPESRSVAVEAVAYDDVGRRAAAGRRDGSVEVWDLKERARALRLEGHRARVTAVAFTPDGALLVSASFDGSARVWELASGSCVHVLQHATGAKRRVLGLAVSPDGQLVVTAGEDGRARLWALAQGEALRALDAHRRPVRAVSFDRRGEVFLTAGEDHRLALWSAQGDRLLELESTAGFSHALLDRDGVAITAGAPLEVERFDLRVRARLGAIAGEGPLALSPLQVSERDRGLLLRAGAGVLRLVDPETGAEKVRLVDDDDVLLSCALSPDGAHALTGAESGRLKVWMLRPAPAEPPNHALVDDDATLAATSDADDRVVVTALADDASSSVTSALPTPGRADVVALRRELSRAPVWRQRQIVWSLDPRDPGSLELLLEVLAGAFEWTVRQAAVDVLAAALGDPRPHGTMVTLLDGARLSVGAREGLALAMGQTRSPVLVPRLVRQLDDPDARVRRAVAVALQGAPDARAVQPLIDALRREPEPIAAALLEETLVLVTGAGPGREGWAEWWREARRGFVVGRAPVHDDLVRVRVDGGRRQDDDVVWSARVRGQGPPVLVLPELGLGPAYLERCLRWLEAERTVVYVDMGEPTEAPLDPSRACERLERLRAALETRRLIDGAGEVVVAHGLACAIAAEWPARRPRAGGLVLVSPFSGERAWRDGLGRLERAARARRDGDLVLGVRLLEDPRRAERVEAEERASARRDLFTTYFADTTDLLIGHLLGPRVGREPRHALERVHEQRPPREAGRGAGWHDVPTVAVVGLRSTWTDADDVARVAAQSTRGRVVALEGAARMPFYEDRAAFAQALRSLSE